MPFRRRYRKKYRRKRNTYKNTAKASYTFNKNSGRNTVALINRQIGIPDSIYTKLAIALSHNQITGTYDEDYLIMNSINDPCGSYSNVRPLWYTEYMSMYDKYKVMAAKVYFQIYNAGDAVEIVTWPSDDPTASSSMDESKCRFGARMQITGNNLNSTKTINKYYNFRRIAGEDMTDADYEAGAGSDPLKKIYLHICYINALRDGTAIDLHLKIYMIQYVKFFNRNEATLQ